MRNKKDIKTYTGKIGKNWIAKNILLVIAGILGLVIVVSILLNTVTRHNREQVVPDFTTLSIKDATKLAQKKNVRLDITDSVYVKNIPSGAVYDQTPAVGSHVKKNRRILITINAINPQKVEMPALVGFSLRQAKTVLMTKGLQIGTLTYVDDIATNNVLAQKCNGRDIAPGVMIESDNPIDLLLGLNGSDAYTYVPNLTGYTYEIAEGNIIDNSLNIGKVIYDRTVINYEDSLQAIVYKQSPVFTNQEQFLLGTRVDIYLTKDSKKIGNPTND
ncbi:MAG: PASTA domain-containing protein [Bacteroidales bacterium]|nr:PASTA domain-containing protein [Bacteroidales bacterium]